MNDYNVISTRSLGRAEFNYDADGWIRRFKITTEFNDAEKTWFHQHFPVFYTQLDEWKRVGFTVSEVKYGK